MPHNLYSMIIKWKCQVSLIKLQDLKKLNSRQHLNESNWEKLDFKTLVEKELSKKASSTAQKIKFSIKDFLSKCEQIRSFLRIWSHLLKKSLMENFIFVQCTTMQVLVSLVLKNCTLASWELNDEINVFNWRMFSYKYSKTSVSKTSTYR